MIASALNPKTLGELVRLKRKQAKLTQDIAAMMCGVTKKTLIRVEKGEDVYISTLFKILDGLGVRLTTLNKGAIGSDGWY